MALNDGYDPRFDESKITPEEDKRIKEAMKSFTDYDTAVKEYGKDAVEVTGSGSGGSPSFKVNTKRARANRLRRQKPGSSGSGEVWVDTYVRSDGAVVHGHWRKRKNR